MADEEIVSGLKNVENQIARNREDVNEQTRTLNDFDVADAVTQVFSRISNATPSVVRIADEGRYRVRAGPLVSRVQAERLLALAVMHDIPMPEVIEE